ncbi:hypothetical protein [Nonlabens ulvanivorans]|uniref:Na(+)-translocating NADH-quinone reductase subunit F n=1 Tax=Nonlabens ulvanivorans TaxID=906888 RepID=A0A084JZR5_NONUL|nr:hypothetical protein [Nonlabens ulvanivorans]KEZ94449.1 Na(+)-translocating NADH-quinone reductase subunit F [Nonlabens ulvanivorans]PRX12345.1 hypothetical protein LY02_02759 [Nonlabens ulvanivorans]
MSIKNRLESSITKLYKAFHDGTLHPECACHCAVGNICDNKDFWKHLSDDHGSVKLNYVGLVNEKLGKRFNGYLPSELLRIEHAFLQGCGYQLPLRHHHFKPKDPKSQVIQFEGLCAAITILCKLEGIDDISDYSKLFETDNHQPIHSLDLVF